MQNRLENTSISFQRPASLAPFIAIAAVLAAVLLIGAIVAGSSKNWTMAIIFVVALIGLAIYAGASVYKMNTLSSGLNQNRIEWSTAMPDLQRQSLNIEVRELSKILEVEAGQLSELQSAYIVAEDLALRQIQHEEGVPLMRHVSVAGVPFDAVFQKNGVLVCCEVAFLVSPELRQDRSTSMIKKITQAKSAIEGTGTITNVRLMIALVTQIVSEDEQILRSALNTQKFGDTPVDIDIRLLDFEALQKLYVTE
jgi:hypothetical protein